MSRYAKPNQAAAVGVKDKPYYVTSKALLHFSYRTPTGIYRAMEVELNVEQLLCLRRTVNELAAMYKAAAQRLVDEL